MGVSGKTHQRPEEEVQLVRSNPNQAHAHRMDEGYWLSVASSCWSMQAFKAGSLSRFDARSGRIALSWPGLKRPTV